ncbi:suppressor of cytokine signaling 2 [Etheostoma cragini]|uniref:suppressor of cytokine signaling 2 n=1 Tax=Etheostoma cragini TaxID=417921 RepID=UPI00155E13E2|nr:suppressor of cytokine signaling 2 [Etheostoma cragini]
MVSGTADTKTVFTEELEQLDDHNQRSWRSLKTTLKRQPASMLLFPLSPGWYWGSLTATEAKAVLQDAPEGAFLVRDSSQRDFLFTISAMTAAGATNLRIEYRHGTFTLDSVVLVKPRLKRFSSVVRLVEHYVQLSRASNNAVAVASASNSQPNGTVQLLLTRPVYRAPPALQHLCRVAINRRTRRVQELPLPPRLKDYLTDYVYHV